MKVGTIALLAIGILVARPVLNMPAVTPFASNGEGPAFAGTLFPFLFITIACGALSGFHALIASGTTPKLLEKESQTRMIGYGGMLTESFVAIMALVTACILDQHLYFALNAPAALTGGTPETAAEYVNNLPLGIAPISPTSCPRQLRPSERNRSSRERAALRRWRSACPKSSATFLAATH